MSTPETIPAVSDFSQTIDVDIDLEGGQTKSLPSMPGYLIRSADMAIDYIRSLVELGIKSITCRLGGGLCKAVNDGYAYAPLLINTLQNTAHVDNTEAQVTQHAAFYKKLRVEFPKESLYIIADPFGLAPNLSDGAWGARTPHGTLDFNKTAWLLAHSAVEFASVGVDAILTMGRIEYEIEISRQALQKAGKEIDIFAFSQNNESKAAYVYLERLRKSDSFQKIIPGNITEMKVRTILDIYAGADAIIVKPADNLHVIQFTADFINNPTRALSYLRTTLETDFYTDRPDIRKRIVDLLKNEDIFEKNSQNVKIGTYTVSGSYFINKLLGKEKGDDFLFSVEDERFRNILSILGHRRAFIIDRSAEWYIRHLDLHKDPYLKCNAVLNQTR